MNNIWAPKIKVAIHTHNESGQEVLKSRTIELELQDIDHSREYVAYYAANDPENPKDFYEVWIPAVYEDTTKVTQ